ncbi:MAG TPA: hypothetical protein DCP53_03875 [Elusimicrobia bacterium]|nr:MAG: hypothetical protein A2551_02150 [Elusimicrobia bacterium RIFOXYD2_FULL_34_30]HAM38519.1 hypothetical protein [Elusimicrobiota bacterium]
MGKVYKLDELSLDEINAVLTHKWLLSEKACQDVGIDFALDDWYTNHSKKWRDEKMKADFESQRTEIEKHKWYLSQKLGYDVGTQQAAIDWIKNGYAEAWRNKSGPYCKLEEKKEVKKEEKK